LRDAGEHIAALPARLRRSREWQIATELLLSAAERGIVMLARITITAIYARKYVAISSWRS
jgi:hypothetical protein